MRNISILLLAFMLFLLSPIIFGAATVQQPTYQSSTTACEQSLTNGMQFADNLKLMKLIKEQQTLLIQANTHIMKLYQYLDKKTNAG